MSEKRFNLRYYIQSREDALEDALAAFDKIVDGFNYPPTLLKNMNTGEYYFHAWLTRAELDVLGLEGKFVQDIFFVPPEAADE